MAVGWFICPYKPKGERKRYCAMDDFTAQVVRWSETEILGDRAIVKVNATNAVLDTIAATPTFRRIPLPRLDDPLSSLTAGQRNTIKNEVLDAGYTLSEVNARFPNLANNTLGDVLRFLTTRRLKPRYDDVTGTIICDGAVQGCKSVDAVDAEVT